MKRDAFLSYFLTFAYSELSKDNCQSMLTDQTSNNLFPMFYIQFNFFSYVMYTTLKLDAAGEYYVLPSQVDMNLC